MLEPGWADQAVVDGVAVAARVGAAREQALQRIDRERQLLEIDLDEVDQRKDAVLRHIDEDVEIAVVAKVPART